MTLKLKVCGMRDEENLAELAEVKPDFIGMIFYPDSPRYVGRKNPGVNLPDGIKKVGVFVNAPTSSIMDYVRDFELDVVQLHGSESPKQVKELKSEGLVVIKVFSVQDYLPLERILEFEGLADYFLFDTKTPGHGGSGNKFDWSILGDYTFNTPWFLSGGVDLEDIADIKNLRMKGLFGVDINSRFETSPGTKDIAKIKKLKEQL